MCIFGNEKWSLENKIFGNKGQLIRCRIAAVGWGAMSRGWHICGSDITVVCGGDTSVGSGASVGGMSVRMGGTCVSGRAHHWWSALIYNGSKRRKRRGTKNLRTQHTRPEREFTQLSDALQETTTFCTTIISCRLLPHISILSSNPLHGKLWFSWPWHLRPQKSYNCWKIRKHPTARKKWQKRWCDPHVLQHSNCHAGNKWGFLHPWWLFLVASNPRQKIQQL